MTDKMIWAVIAIAGVFVFGETAVAFKEAGITGASISAFFSELGVNELWTGAGLSVTGVAGFFAGKMRENHLVRKHAEAINVD